MIRLQIAVSNLKASNFHPDEIEQISFKFGPISTILPLVQGHSGKSLFLQFTQQQILQIYQLYACGLYIQNQHGRYFSLLSLQQLKITDRVVCQQIFFLNDARQAKIRCQFSIASSVFNNPRLPQTNKIQERQNNLNLLKKPPVPKQKTTYNNFLSTEENRVPNSFLYGNRLSKTQNNVGSDHLKTMKEGVRKQNEVKNSLQKSKNKINQKSQSVMAKKPEPKYIEEQDLLVDHPPMMEFTNDDQAKPEITLKVPQVQYIEYAESVQQNLKKIKNQRMGSTEPKFATFNRNDSNFNRKSSSEAPSEFQLAKTQNVNMPPKPKALSKEEIKNLAKKEAQSKEVKDTVMIPIMKGDKFELVPLSKLKPQQIIQYVQKQKKNEEEAYQNQLRKARLEERQRQILEKNKKLQVQIERRQKQKAALQRQASYKKKHSIQSKQSFTGLIKEQKQSQNQSQSRQNNQNQNEDEYMSDFESVTGSVIKSRISSRGGNYKGMSKQQQSQGLEEEYSQEFDSYSHSALSKTNLNRNKAPSISDYSDSYRSISQSYGRQ